MTLRKRTRAVHAGTRRSQYGEVSEALFLTQGFVYDSAEAAEARFETLGTDEIHLCPLWQPPPVRMFEDRIAALEGVEDAFACTSGMAAVTGALTALLKAGDRVVSSRALFGSCTYVLAEVLGAIRGSRVVFVDGTDMAQWQAAIRPGTAVVFLESISNPTLDLVDLPAVVALAHGAGAKVVVDNAMATPVYSCAAEAGADLVVYSTTKHIDGQGRCLGGVILGSRALIRGPVETYMKHTGGAMNPFAAWLALKGLETLDLRVRAQSEAALRIGAALQGHPAVSALRYPLLDSHPQAALARRLYEGGGTVLALELAGAKEAAFRFLNALEIVLISNNFADAKSIATHPATTTHQRLSDDEKARVGITPGLIRLSIGLEDPADLMDDLTRALDAA